MTQEKFKDMYMTAKGEQRASVRLKELKTLWFNTGTKCNLSCKNCYIESTPTNDRLEYITDKEVLSYLHEIRKNNEPTQLIGLTGGEPFLNPYIIEIADQVLKNNFELLILTNALRVIDFKKEKLIKLKNIYHDKLHIRVSLDHHSKELHEKERGKNTFDKTLVNIKWLYDHEFNLSIAGRSLSDEVLNDAKAAYQNLLKKIEVNINLEEKLVVFPEMDTNKEVPEITVDCWSILNKTPDQQMCATERMVVKRKGHKKPTVLPCTLIAYDESFDLGDTLEHAQKEVFLKHKFCAQFCVLGGASCSSAK